MSAFRVFFATVGIRCVGVLLLELHIVTSCVVWASVLLLELYICTGFG